MVTKDHLILRDGGRSGAPAGWSMLAANLEDVGVVGLETNSNRDRHRLVPEVGHSNLLVTGRLPEELLDGQMERPECRANAVAVEQVGIGQMGDQPVVFLVDRRAQEERSLALELEDQARQEARAFVKEPLFAQPAGHGIAVTVKHGKRLAMLEDAAVCLGQTGSREQVIRTQVRWIQRYLARLRGLIDGFDHAHSLTPARARRLIDRTRRGDFEP